MEYSRVTPLPLPRRYYIWFSNVSYAKSAAKLLKIFELSKFFCGFRAKITLKTAIQGTIIFRDMQHIAYSFLPIFFTTERFFFLSPNKEFGKPHVLRSSLRSDIFFDGQIKAGKKEKWWVRSRWRVATQTKSPRGKILGGSESGGYLLSHHAVQYHRRCWA